MSFYRTIFYRSLPLSMFRYFFLARYPGELCQVSFLPVFPTERFLGSDGGSPTAHRAFPRDVTVSISAVHVRPCHRRELPILACFSLLSRRAG